MEYTLTDWLIDCRDHGWRCLSCKGFTLEYMGEDTAQCYSCGRWHIGTLLGRSSCQLIQDSAYSKRIVHARSHKNKPSDVQSHSAMQFEDSLTTSFDLDFPDTDQ